MSNSLIRCRVMEKREATQLGLQESECPLELTIAGEGLSERIENGDGFEVP